MTWDYLIGIVTGFGVGVAIVSVHLGRLWQRRVERARIGERDRVARRFDEMAEEADGDNAGYYWADAACVVRGMQ